MSNFTKDQPSIRVFAPPGGRSTTNIFGTVEPEPPMSMKKDHMASDIFGCKQDRIDSAPAKPARPMTNNIFGTDMEQPAPKASVYSDKNKSTIFDEPPPQQQPSNKPDRQRSNIFGANEPVQSGPNRPVAEKFKSNIFGHGDDDCQTKRQGNTRQGLRVGYNPINGESYATKDGLNSKVETSEIEKESDEVNKTSDEDHAVQQVDNEQKQQEETNGDVHPSVEPVENGKSETPVEKPTNGHTNGHSTVKNSNTSVRVCHPPGGRSNGPLW